MHKRCCKHSEHPDGHHDQTTAALAESQQFRIGKYMQ